MDINPREIDEKLAELDTQRAKADHQAARQLSTLHSAVGDKPRYTSRNRRIWGRPDDEVIVEARQLLAAADSDHTLIGAFYASAVRKALDAYDTGIVEATRLESEMERVEAPWFEHRWTRFFQLRSTKNAKIHNSRFCGALHRSDPGDMGWHPELSGLTEEQAVAKLGAALCSRCFRAAPAR